MFQKTERPATLAGVRTAETDLAGASIGSETSSTPSIFQDVDRTAAPEIREMTPAGAHLCQRYFVRPIIADLVAFIAGFGANWRAA